MKSSPSLSSDHTHFPFLCTETHQSSWDNVVLLSKCAFASGFGVPSLKGGFAAMFSTSLATIWKRYVLLPIGFLTFCCVSKFLNTKINRHCRYVSCYTRQRRRYYPQMNTLIKPNWSAHYKDTRFELQIKTDSKWSIFFFNIYREDMIKVVQSSIKNCFSCNSI